MATKNDIKKRPMQPLISQIVIKPPLRKTSNVGQWRTAMQAADMGRMKLLFDLFEDLLIDGVLSDAVDKRISAVTNSPITFQDADGQEVDEITELIDSPDFEQLLDTIMQARFWGRAAGEFSFADGYFNFTPLPFKHINLDNQNILINEYDATGIDYSADDHILVIGKPRQFGLFLKTAPYAIWKRGGFGDYAQWLELFGMPQRVGKYSSYDPESRQTLVAAMEQAGSAPWIVIPKETEVETVNNTGTGSSSGAHNDFRKACNEEILITILGQTMTTLDGSSKSQSETHKAVEEGKNRSDMRYVRRVLNWLVVPLLEKRGFPVKGGKFVFPEDTEVLSVDEIVSLSAIIEIPASFIHEKYSIPLPEAGEPIAGAISASPPPEDPIKEKKPKSGAKADPIKDEPIENADHRNFLIRLFDFFVAAPGRGASNGKILTLADNGNDLTDQLINQVASGDRSFNAELFDFISLDLISALDKKPVNLVDLGFVYNYQNDAFRTAQELNIFHFSAAKTLAEIQRLNELFRASKSFEEFYKAANDELKVFNKTHQRVEWQTATLIAASTENYNRLSQKTKLFPFWEYRTVGDNKVRDEHRKLHGVILPADDPRWLKIWPPNGWKCRCYVVPKMAHEVKDVDIEANRALVDAYFETSEWKQNEAQGFGVNRALLPEVFTEDQMYIHKFPNQAAKLLKDVNYHTHGLKSYEASRALATSDLPKFDGNLDDFISSMKKEDGKLFFTDYNGRSIMFDKTVFLPDQEKISLIKAASETLKLPDEVWINNTNASKKEFNRFVFLKYWKDQTMMVSGSVESGKVYQVTDWQVVTEKGAKLKYRWGLLVKKPSYEI